MIESSTPGRRPLVVVDDPSVYTDLLAEVAGAGWNLVTPRQVRSPADCAEWLVSSESDAQGALLSAVSGAGVVARVLAPRLRAVDSAWQDLVDDLVEDLTSLGPVLRPLRPHLVSLDRLTWQIAHDLARGLRLEAAATRAHVSSRTANRRVSEARAALGAGSRAHLVRALRSPDRVPAAVIER